MHGGDYHCTWCKTKCDNGFPIHAPNGLLDLFDFVNMNVAVCIKKKNHSMIKTQNDFLKHI